MRVSGVASERSGALDQFYEISMARTERKGRVGASSSENQKFKRQIDLISIFLLTDDIARDKHNAVKRDGPGTGPPGEGLDNGATATRFGRNHGTEPDAAE